MTQAMAMFVVKLIVMQINGQVMELSVTAMFNYYIFIYRKNHSSFVSVLSKDTYTLYGNVFLNV